MIEVPDFIIYIESKGDAPDRARGAAWLKDLQEYESSFSPRERADLAFFYASPVKR